jgi:preprotein translocase subunit SecE
MIQKLIDFIKDTRSEMTKVTWPSRNDIIRDTVLVILVSAGLAVFLGLLDLVFSYLLNKFIL